MVLFVVLQGLSLFRLFLFVAATFLLLLSPLLLSFVVYFSFKRMRGGKKKLMREGYPNPISVLQNYYLELFEISLPVRTRVFSFYFSAPFIFIIYDTVLTEGKTT